MLSFLRAARETAAAGAIQMEGNPIFTVREKTAAVKAARRELTLEQLRLRVEIERTRRTIDAARNHFEQVIDPMLIDCYIYELNAAQLRYQFLLRKFKSQEL